VEITGLSVDDSSLWGLGDIEDKKFVCKTANITLLEIPYWWDNSADSIAASLKELRSDLITAQVKALPIPKTPFKGTRKPRTTPSGGRKISDIGQLIMLSKDWLSGMDPTGWLLSEKYDGIRAVWTGHTFFSKQGNEIKAPQFFREKLPTIPLDGEVWAGRGGFNKVVHISRVVKEDPWKPVKFVVFDAPSLLSPYESRHKYLLDLKAKKILPDHVEVASVVKCTGTDHLQKFSDEIVKSGGEGVILHRADAFYEGGRSDGLYKHKMYYDSEVKYLGLHPTGAGLLCEQPNNDKIMVRCDGATFQNPPPVGSIITVNHEGLYSSAKLRAPHFFRERNDITWDQVVAEWKAKNPDAKEK